MKIIPIHICCLHSHFDDWVNFHPNPMVFPLQQGIQYCRLCGCDLLIDLLNCMKINVDNLYTNYEDRTTIRTSETQEQV